MSAEAKVAGGATPGSFGLQWAGYSTAHWGATPCIKDHPCPRVRPTLNYIIPSLNKTANCTRCGHILSISATSSTCDRAPNRGMKAITAGTSAAEDGLSFRPPDLQSHTAGIGPACSAG